MAASAKGQAVLPAGGRVAAGAAIIGAASNSALTITQTSSKAIIDWASFSIGPGGAVRVDNGAGATLNRVTGGDLSSIEGQLSASGSVYLINPAGVIVGKQGRIDVGGRFVAATLQVGAGDFLAGGDLAFSGASSAAVINYGRIGSLGGDVILIASRVENHGALLAPRGVAGLAAGYQVLVRDRALQDGQIAVRLGGPDGRALNAGEIRAAEVELRAQGGNVYALAGNTGSIIEATGVQSGGGRVFLVADGGDTTVRGQVQARGPGGGPGFIETSGGRLTLDGAQIDAGAGGTWLVDPYDLTVDVSAASSIQASLGAGTNVTLQTTATSASGPGVQDPSGAGDIQVAAPISWSTAANLTLDAYHSIRITQPITISGAGAGAGSLTLTTNDGGTGGTLSFGTAGRVQFDDPGLDGDSSHLIIDGQAYTLVTSLASLDSHHADAYVALARSLDAGGTTYGAPPVADIEGTFEGLGNMISNLTINDSTGCDVAMTCLIDVGASVRDLRFVNANITSSVDGAFVGVLAGENDGDVFGVSSTGQVTDVGESNAADIGGLVGFNLGTIDRSWSSATVRSGAAANAGGLVGVNNASIVESYATGPVTVAGLGGVSSFAGGLVGYNQGPVSGSYATGAVTANSDTAGGLFGEVSDGGDVSDSYATGAVSGYDAGGLIGGDNVFIAIGAGTSYAAGLVSGTHTAGGFIGDGSAGAITYTSDYFDASVNAAAVGAGSSTGITGLTTAQLTGGSLPSGFSSATWRSPAGVYPLLKWQRFDVTVSLTGTVGKTYDGTTSASLAAGNYALGGVLAGDAVVLNDPSAGSYDDRHAGTGKTVSVTGLALTGADAVYYELLSPSASGAVGAITPLTLTAQLTGAVGKTYDGTTAAALTPANFSLSGVIGGDDVQLNDPAAGTFDTKDVGTGKTVSVTGLALGGADAGDYALAATSASAAIGAITARTLTASLVGSVSRTYDGTTAASLTAGDYALSGVLGGDSVSLVAPAIGTFDTRDAGTAKTISVSGLGLGGADAGDYALASTSVSGAVGTITPKTLTISLTGTVSKVYDGTTAVVLSAGDYSLTGVIGADAVSVTAGGGGYDSKDVGTGKTVSLTGLALGGADAGDYSLASTSVSAAIGTITPKALTISLSGSIGKVYDGTTAVVLAPGDYSLSGVIGADAVSVAAAGAGYDTKDVGTGKTVSITGLTLGGADAGDYALASTSVSGAIGTITPKALTVSLTGAVSKVYDGTTAVVLSPGDYSLSGVIGADAVSVSAAGAGYDTKDVGTGKTVSVNGLALGGADAGDYSLASTSVSAAIGTITPKSLAASLVGTVSRTYDGTTSARLTTANYGLSGVLAGDVVRLNDPLGGAYDNRQVGAGKTVTVTGLSLAGADAGDYRLDSTSISADVGTITPKTLSASLTGSVAKTYDGTVDAEVTGADISLAGVVGGDVVLANPEGGAYDTKDAGTGKTVSATGLTLSGADASDYRLASATASGPIGTITPRPITVTATDAAKAAGLPDPPLGYGITSGSLVAGDSLTGGEARDPGEAPGAYAILQGTLAASADYRLTFVPGVFTIRPWQMLPANLPGSSLDVLSPPDPGTGPQAQSPTLAAAEADPERLPYPDNRRVAPGISFGSP